MNVNWLFDKCHRYETSLSLLAAGALPEAGQVAVEAHLRECAACRAKLVELQNLADGLTRLSESLPQVEAPVALRRRWMTAVREPVTESDGALETGRPALDIVLAWLSGRRLAWGSFAVVWVLVLFFRFSAPDAPKPASVAAVPPVSLREVLLALKVDRREAPFRAEAGNPVHNKQPPPDALPPRSQRPGTQSTTNSEIT